MVAVATGLGAIVEGGMIGVAGLASDVDMVLAG